MNKIIILALCLFIFCSKISAQEVKYNYDNNRATIYNALNLTNEQTKIREEILNKNAKILDEKYAKLKKESCKLLALKKGNVCNSEILEQKKVIKNIKKDISKLLSEEDKEFKKCLTNEQKTKYKTIQKLQKHDLKKEINRAKIYKANPQMEEFAKPQISTCKRQKTSY